jgi:hypothetical protein
MNKGNAQALTEAFSLLRQADDELQRLRHVWCESPRNKILQAIDLLAAQPSTGQEEMTEAERIAFERFDKPEWAQCSSLRMRVLLSVCHETNVRCGAKIENLQDALASAVNRQANLEASIKRIRAAISTDSCDGDSTYAFGVNAAVARHTEGIDIILKELGVCLDRNTDKPASYWCVVCQREILPEVNETGNLYVHDDIPHPETMDYAEEDKPQ